MTSGFAPAASRRSCHTCNVHSILRRLARRLRLGSLERGDFATESKRSVANIDALAAGYDHGAGDDAFDVGGSGYPPGYVKPYDEGRPRK